MRRFTRFRRAIARALARVTGAPRTRRARRDRDSDTFTGGTVDRGDGSRLPPGWSLVGLYHHGQATTRIDATGDTEVTDSEISEADALIVWYKDAGADGYRWIHGAPDWDTLADIVDRTIIIVSPVSGAE